MPTITTAKRSSTVRDRDNPVSEASRGQGAASGAKGSGELNNPWKQKMRTFEPRKTHENLNHLMMSSDNMSSENNPIDLDNQINQGADNAFGGRNGGSSFEQPLPSIKPPVAKEPVKSSSKLAAKFGDVNPKIASRREHPQTKTPAANPTKHTSNDAARGASTSRTLPAGMRRQQSTSSNNKGDSTKPLYTNRTHASANPPCVSPVVLPEGYEAPGKTARWKVRRLATTEVKVIQQKKEEVKEEMQKEKCGTSSKQTSHDAEVDEHPPTLSLGDKSSITIRASSNSRCPEPGTPIIESIKKSDNRQVDGSVTSRRKVSPNIANRSKTLKFNIDKDDKMLTTINDQYNKFLLDEEDNGKDVKFDPFEVTSCKVPPPTDDVDGETTKDSSTNVDSNDRKDSSEDKITDKIDDASKANTSDVQDEPPAKKVTSPAAPSPMGEVNKALFGALKLQRAKTAKTEISFCASSKYNSDDFSEASDDSENTAERETRLNTEKNAANKPVKDSSVADAEKEGTKEGKSKENRRGSTSSYSKKKN